LPLCTYVCTSVKPASASASRRAGIGTLLRAPRLIARSRHTQLAMGVTLAAPPAGSVAPVPGTAHRIRLPLPATHLATALVMRPAHRNEDPDIVVSREAGSLHPTAYEALARHIGDVRTIDLPDVTAAPLPPVELLSVFGASKATCQAVQDATAGVAVALLCPRSEAQSGQRAVRAAAVLLSEPGDVTIDTAVPRVWAVRDRAADAPRSADWFVLDRVGMGGSPGTRTHGLSRFGLPELLVEDVADADLPAWDAVFVGVAHVLLQRLAAEDDDALVLDETLRLTVADIAAGYAEPFDDSDPTVRRATQLRLSFDPSGEGDDTGVLVLAGSPVTDLFS